MNGGVPDEILFQRQARICRVMADPKRLRLLSALRDGERSVGDLAAALGILYPNVSQHLNLMRDAGVLAIRREGTTVFYRLAYPRIVEACDIVHDILRAQLADAAALAGHPVVPAATVLPVTPAPPVAPSEVEHPPESPSLQTPTMRSTN